MNSPMRGIVLHVRYRNTSRGKITAVDVSLLDETGQQMEKVLTHVPLMYGKMNGANGEEWTPEKGDLVVLGFFNQNLRDPFVMGYLGPYDGGILDPGTDPHPQYFRKRSGTSERIDKDGNRTTIIEGNETVTVNTGDLTITVKQGKATVTIEGKTVWTSKGTIEHIGSDGATAEGNVQGKCICTYTGKPHPMVSATVKSSL